MNFPGSDIVALISRWLHIMAAMAAIGGPMFLRWAYLPAVATLPDESRNALREAVRRRWAIVVMAAITFLLVSGLYNFGLFEATSKNWGPPWSKDLQWTYRILFMVKFALALAIFFLASALVGRSPALAKIRENARFWVTIYLLLGALLVGVSNEMRMMHAGPTQKVEKAAE